MFERVKGGRRAGGSLFERIGCFLDAQGLPPEPANYALAHATLTDPDGPLAQAVTRLTDGGVRLSGRELAELGGIAGGAGAPAVATTDDKDDRAVELVTRTQSQVEGFAEMMRSIHAETRGFGRDIAAGAAAIATPQGRSGEEIARIAAAMVTRTRAAEARLAQATEETDALRAKLAEARDTARRDPLTGLPNRRAFDEALSARDERRGPFVLAMCDVDHFKRINDRHGHAVGDRVLRAIAGILAEQCAGQLVVRYGGEEFAVLVAGLPIGEAVELLDRARGVIGARRFRDRDTDSQIGQVGISIGVTAMARGEAGEQAFERADRLLYTAKAQGRDQVQAG